MKIKEPIYLPVGMKVEGFSGTSIMITEDVCLVPKTHRIVDLVTKEQIVIHEQSKADKDPMPYSFW